MAQLRWAVVGTGNIVEGTMAPAMNAEAHCDAIAVVSRDQGRAETFAAKLGARFAYSNYTEMLANPEVEAVFIATPNALHAEQVVQAAAAGKHVFCDKPIATTVADAVEEVRTCAEEGVTFGVNFHNRHLPWVQETRDLIGAGKVGDVMTVHVEASAGARPPVGWRNNRALAGLGTVYNVGVHVFDFLRFILASDPVEVTAMFDDEGGSYEVETQALVLLRFASGTVAYVNCNQSVPYPQNDITFYGRSGRIKGVNLTRSRFNGELHVLGRDGEEVIVHENPSGLAHRRCLAAYTNAVLSGEEPAASGLDGLHSVILADAIATSAREGVTVRPDYRPVESVAEAG